MPVVDFLFENEFVYDGQIPKDCGRMFDIEAADMSSADAMDLIDYDPA